MTSLVLMALALPAARGGSIAGALPDSLTAAGWRWRAERRDDLGRPMAVGDLDGDGHAEVVLAHQAEGLWVIEGGPDGPAACPDVRIPRDEGFATWAWSLTVLPDLDGDGDGELFVGNATIEGGRGQLFGGSAAELDAATPWDVAEASKDLGLWEAALAGDLDGDGHPELVLVAWYAVVVFPGGADGPELDRPRRLLDSDTVLQGAAIGDLDGDGLQDLAVGAPEEGGVGVVRVWRGAHEGVADAPDWTWTEGTEDGHLGQRLATGDLDGDGVDDLVVAQPGDGESDCGDGCYPRGRVHLFAGGSAGLGDAPATTIESWDTDIWGLGLQLVVGDLDGDGRDDLVLPWPDAEAVYAYAGAADGLDSSWDWRLELPEAVGLEDAAAAGDADGDGRADLFITTEDTDHSAVFGLREDIDWVPGADDCPEPDGDTGAADSGSSDSGSSDSGSSDSGSSDSGSSDSGSSDSGSSDSGSSDSGSSDSGSSDSGARDGGSPDAGAPEGDAGTKGCSALGAPSGGVMLALVALGLWCRRRAAA